MFRIVSPIIALFLFFQSINVQVVDIVRLGDLVEHANFHAQEYGDDWISFFVKHYGADKEEHEQKSNHKEHEKLPFSEHISSITSAFIQIPFESSAIHFTFEKDLNKTFFYSDLYRYISSVDFFQPPQFS